MESLSHSGRLGICLYTPPPPPLLSLLVRPSSSKLRPFSTSKWVDRLISDFQFTAGADSSSPLSTANLSPPPLSPPERHLAIPIDFYQVLGAEPHFLEDGNRRSFEVRASKPPQHGFSHEALISSRQILQAACETLANSTSRRDNNQGLAEDEQDTILTDVPWDKVPGALCVLQEAGEAEAVLQIGDSLLKERMSKTFKQDTVLAMASQIVTCGIRLPCNQVESAIKRSKWTDLLTVTF